MTRAGPLVYWPIAPALHRSMSGFQANRGSFGFVKATVTQRWRSRCSATARGGQVRSVPTRQHQLAPPASASSAPPDHLTPTMITIRCSAGRPAALPRVGTAHAAPLLRETDRPSARSVPPSLPPHTHTHTSLSVLPLALKHSCWIGVIVSEAQLRAGSTAKATAWDLKPRLRSIADPAAPRCVAADPTSVLAWETVGAVGCARRLDDLLVSDPPTCPNPPQLHPPHPPAPCVS